MSTFRPTAFKAAAVLLLNVALASCAEVVTSLNVVNGKISPDGFGRSAVLANGTYPGPLITANINDRFLINVTDSLTDKTMNRATTVHWHGLYQKTTPEMDGVSMITQCPIIPGNSYLYNFSAPGQSGTYWYHSHLSTQYCDGLAGPLVIYDPEDPLAHLYDVDDESTVVTISDWNHDVSNVAHPAGAGPPPASNATLINGKGRYVKGPASDLAVMRAQPGMRQRMRFVNIGCNDFFDISIDNHKLTIIEVDGLETEPYEVDQFRIHSGQRYSVVVSMDQEVDNYWIRANPSLRNVTSGGVNSAILRYDGASITEPKDRGVNAISGTVMKESDVHGLISPSAPGGHDADGADVVLYLNQSLTAKSAWTINNVSFFPPSVPVLLQILGGNTDASKLLPKGSVYGLPLNSVIEVHINGGFSHPFHLHGTSFYVVKPAGTPSFNYDNPIQRDVVSTGTDANDEVVFRFKTDNPGPWFLHCHIDWHLEDGLALVFAADTADTAAYDPPSKDWEDLCPVFDANNPDTHFNALTPENAY